MSNSEILPSVLASLIQKMAELEKKNALLADQVKKSNQEKKNLESELELQEYINDSLRDDLKKKDAKFATHKDRIKAYEMARGEFGDEIYKDMELRDAFHDFCKHVGFCGSITEVKESQITWYKMFAPSLNKYYYSEKLYRFLKDGYDSELYYKY